MKFYKITCVSLWRRRFLYDFKCIQDVIQFCSKIIPVITNPFLLFDILHCEWIHPVWSPSYGKILWSKSKRSAVHHSWAPGSSRTGNNNYLWYNHTNTLSSLILVVSCLSMFVPVLLVQQLNYCCPVRSDPHRSGPVHTSVCICWYFNCDKRYRASDQPTNGENRKCKHINEQNINP